MSHGPIGDSPPADIDAGTAKLVASTMQALATPSRLLILGVLRHVDASVSDLADKVGMERSAVSQQLRYLRSLGLVDTERQGRHIIYRLFDDHVARLLDEAVYHSEHLAVRPMSMVP
jgi:DNA-binding transcriptional ArsR family regulator